MGLLAKIIMILVAGYFVFKAVKNALRLADGKGQHPGRRRTQDGVVDMCPKCGDMLKSGHRC